jgi:DNA ligase (NAD+)
MGSLDKCQAQDEVDKWYKDTVGKLAGAVGQGELPALKQDFVISEKLDGISISLKYVKGKLVQALTRGDGETGEDILRNVKLMEGVPQKVRDLTGYVRGEIILKKSKHKKHVPEYKNPRNAASGIAKRESDPKPCQYLTIVAYQIITQDHSLPSKATEFKLLAALGFIVPNWFLITGGSTYKPQGGAEETCKGNPVTHIYDQYVYEDREALDYDIDGLVVEFNDYPSMEFLGEHGGRPKGARAFKFPHDAKPTTLKDIVWQVGNSGRITPVAIFDPVDLAGATVTQASLHNESNIKKLASNCPQGLLGIDDQIMVSRRNDVIPYVESVLTPNQNTLRFAIPRKCPSCNHDTKKVGEYITCNFSKCPAQISGAVKRWVKKLDIKDWGDTLIDALCDQGLVKSPADLYGLDAVTLSKLELSGKKVGMSTAKKVLNNLYAKKELRIADFVGSLGIHLCGRSIAQMIADAGYDTLEKMEDATVAQIAAIPRMGQTKAEAFVDGYQRCKKLIDDLLRAGVTIKAPIVGNLSGKSFCFTGFRNKDLEDKVLNAGGAMKSGVSKSLNYLVAKNPKSGSGKVKKATGYGVTVIGISDLEAML